MKIAFRNFLTTLRRYKASSLLNIIGLTLAFTAFYVILTQVWWELGYNRSIADAERIYLIEGEDWHTPGNWSATLCRPIAERVIASSPHVEAGGCMWGGFSDATVWRQNAEKMGYDKFTAAQGSISLPLVDVFPFRAVAGDVHDLKKARSAIVSRSTAERMEIGLGDLIWLNTDNPTAENAYEVVALFEDFPDNSLLSGCQIAVDLGDQFLYKGSEWCFNYFVKFRQGADPQLFEKTWKETIWEMLREQGQADKATDDDIPGMRLAKLGDLYFDTNCPSAPCAHGSRATTYALLGIAVLVIVLAFVNFVNFFFALVPVRIRSVNTFKVFGAPAAALRFNFVFEAVGLVVVSLLAAWYLAFFIGSTELAGFISTSLALQDNLPVVGVVVAIAVAMALAASLYPAFYITSFAPAMVVKGSFGGTRSGRILRTTLLGFQFLVATGLIIATGFIQLQHRYMMHYDMGFDRHNMVAVYLPSSVVNNYATLRGKLLADPRITDVTGAASRLVSVGRMGWGRNFKGERVTFQCYVVQWNFLQTMGIRIVDGRDFTEDDMHKEVGALIFNETAARKYDITTQDRINGFANAPEPIVGIAADFNFQPLQYGVQPFAFYILPEAMTENWDRAAQVIYIRHTEGTDIATLSDYVRRCIAELDARVEPGDIHLQSFEEELGAEYAAERKLTKIVGLFALLAVAIALMGVFGIVLFETQHRRREIAVRKVMGATTREILEMFNRRYVTMVLVCFVIAAPVSIWAIQRWLSTFAYRTPLTWWVFALSLAAVLAVTIVTVTARSWHAANENPADSVKSE